MKSTITITGEASELAKILVFADHITSAEGIEAGWSKPFSIGGAAPEAPAEAPAPETPKAEEAPTDEAPPKKKKAKRIRRTNEQIAADKAAALEAKELADSLSADAPAETAEIDDDEIEEDPTPEKTDVMSAVQAVLSTVPNSYEAVTLVFAEFQNCRAKKGVVAQGTSDLKPDDRASCIAKLNGLVAAHKAAKAKKDAAAAAAE